MLHFWALVFFSFSTMAEENFSRLAQSSLDKQVIQRANYSLSYNNDHEVANWVAYSLDHSKLENCVGRSNYFRTDPLIHLGSATPKDYQNSSYDRGHLLPAGDMKYDRQAMRDTFYMSNISPQPARFNRGRWSMLETLMRAWALKYKKIWIVTGPVLRGHLSTIGVDNKISVPLEYFKVILRRTGNKYEGIGFLMGTDVPHKQLASYAVSINTVEDVSGVNFFAFLSDQDEEEIENQNNLRDWDFNAPFQYLPCSTLEAQ